jgi:hypothetical protein
MAYPTAIGCGCLLGAGGMSHLLAAEWTVQPVFSLETDYDSNRNLSSSPQGSEAATLYGDLRVTRAIESTQIILEPRFDLRRYSSSVWGPGSDRSLNGALTWSGERVKISFTGYIANASTLSTELTETGIINADSRRRSTQANSEFDWLQNDRHQGFLQLGYSSASYSGGDALVQLELPGYRYTSASLGERFFLSDLSTVAISAFGDALSSDSQGNSSHEAGGQVEFTHHFSENISLDASVGESRRVLYGQRGSGTNAALTLARNLERGSASVSYVRSLVPYGNGFLVQRQQVVTTLDRPLTPTLDVTLSLLWLQNNAAAVHLGLERPYYENGVLGLNWKMGESWTLQPQVSTGWSKPVEIKITTSGTRIETLDTAREWRAQVTLVWQPLPASKYR